MYLLCASRVSGSVLDTSGERLHMVFLWPHATYGLVAPWLGSSDRFIDNYKPGGRKTWCVVLLLPFTSDVTLGI